MLVAAGLFWLSSCGTVSLDAPAGMEPMSESSQSESLTRKFFPSTTGEFYFSGTAEEGAPIFGVLQDKQDPGKLFLAGAGGDRSWSENVPLECAGLKVVSVEPLALYLGDIRKDGTAELMLVLSSESEDEKGETSQARKAVYLFELAKGLRLVWYQTIALEGERTTPCNEGTINYRAKPAFTMDSKGRLDSIVVQFDDVGKTCRGGGQCGGVYACDKRRDEGTVRLQWDDDLKGFRTKDATEIVIKIPDVTL